GARSPDAGPDPHERVAVVVSFPAGDAVHRERRRSGRRAVRLGAHGPGRALTRSSIRASSRGPFRRFERGMEYTSAVGAWRSTTALAAGLAVLTPAIQSGVDVKHLLET